VPGMYEVTLARTSGNGNHRLEGNRLRGPCREKVSKTVGLKERAFRVKMTLRRIKRLDSRPEKKKCVSDPKLGYITSIRGSQRR